MWLIYKTAIDNKDTNTMIPFEEAMDITLETPIRTGTERVDFNNALYRILAEDILSDVDMPPFHKAAMDGYACRKADLDKELKVLEVLAAGDIPTAFVGPGQCSKIMTGAMVPGGADTVIMVEHTEECTPGHIRFTGEKTASNIARKAEDVRAGDRVLDQGTLILPQHTPILASVGCTSPLVSKKVRVGILSTGDELVEPHITPGPGKIRNSNGFQLIAQVRAAHCEPNYLGIIPDNEEDTDRAIGKALAENNVVILTGGVSAGDFDFVPKIMRKNGVDIRFQKVAVKPGRPTVFGTTENAAIFGLPGNPVSSFVNFEVFVKPLLFKMMGHQYLPLVLKMPLDTHYKRKKADRVEFIPAHISQEGTVVPARYHGSAHIHAMSLANGIMRIPKGTFELKKGDYTDVRPI